MLTWHVEEDMLGSLYKKAATWWDQPTFLSELGVDQHILFFDLDIYISCDTKWTVERSRAVSLFIAGEVSHHHNTCNSDDEVKRWTHTYISLHFS